ncbi:hypothetical protein [Streptomyces sp. NPDC000188]|uniref:hypothetical protein n=1 Tax=Streptomyces sp. NPDC000188 TaxID=3154245 RepID=UPI003326C2A6
MFWRAESDAFTDPRSAGDELDLAEQLLVSLDLRATTINAAIAALVRDAGHPGIDDRARTLRTELDLAGLTSTTPTSTSPTPSTKPSSTTRTHSPPPSNDSRNRPAAAPTPTTSTSRTS